MCFSCNRFGNPVRHLKLLGSRLPSWEPLGETSLFGKKFVGSRHSHKRLKGGIAEATTPGCVDMPCHHDVAFKQRQSIRFIFLLNHDRIVGNRRTPVRGFE